MNAYVLIQTTSETNTIAGELRTVPGVMSADDLEGPYDAIALTSADPTGFGLQTILDHVHEIEGVTRAVVAPLIRARTKPEGAEAA